MSIVRTRVTDFYLRGERGFTPSYEIVSGGPKGRPCNNPDYFRLLDLLEIREVWSINEVNDSFLPDKMVARVAAVVFEGELGARLRALYS